MGTGATLRAGLCRRVSLAKPSQFRKSIAKSRFVLSIYVENGGLNWRERPAEAGRAMAEHLIDPIHVLVVDDEEGLRSLVRDYLALHGYAVSTAENGHAMREVMRTAPVDVVILDLRMPGEDGFSLARSIKAAGEVRIIMLTASADVIDRVAGLELGADDYVVKPFDLGELLARVRSVMRYATVGRQPPPSRLGHEVRFGRLLVNFDAHAVYGSDGEEVSVTSMEFNLLKVFAEHPGRTLSRKELARLTPGPKPDASDKSIDVRILRLRRKVEENPERPTVLRTVRGQGFAFYPSS